MEAVYRDKLRANHTLIINNLNLKSSGVLDTLEEDGVISSDEAEKIMKNKVTKSQNYRFLYFLKRKDSSRKPFDKFVCALKGKYDFILGKLTMDTSIDTVNTDDDECVYCNLVKVLNPDSISHELFERAAFSDETLETVNDEGLPQTERAKMILELIHSCEKSQSFVEFVWNYFREKYKDVTSNAQDITDLTVCRCRRTKQVINAHGNNTSNIRQAASRIHGNRRDGNYHSHIRQAASRIHGNRRDGNNYSNISQATSRIHGNRGNGNNHSHIRQAASRIHGKRRDENKSIKKADAITIQSAVKKYLPNDTKLLKRSNHVWEKLWVLREAGKWSEYDDLSKKYLDTYADEPDMLVLLYRHGMARSAFYNEDYDGACELFEKAMKELPRSSMSNWHMCRIFGLQSEICARKGQFGEAQSYLTKAHQAAELVGPSFASGTVFFYEGIYLSHLLRCRPNGQSVSSIFEKAKSCYALSIKHYQQERVFAIQSLLNEVYLFLALLELQVDFKTLKSINLDIEYTVNYPMVEYYLDLFENTCWKISTRWAKMMFFVARAELHKRRNNIERSVDYLEDAKLYAHKGDFKDYLRTIEIILCPLQCQINQEPRVVEVESDTDLGSEGDIQSSDQQSSTENDTPCVSIDKRPTTKRNNDDDTAVRLSRKRRSRFSTDESEVPAKGFGIRIKRRRLS